MSGHSKWATIHRDKEITDQKKGQAFTKIANAITLAVKTSGGIVDPASNFKLRLCIEKAREINMPKDKIQKAIDRALGKGGAGELAEIMYEGYAPSGVGVLVETLTDNRQRTVQEVKNIFDKSGGSVASPGSVSFNFKKSGLITLKVNEAEKENIILQLMDMGVDEIEDGGEGLVEVYISPDNLEGIKSKLIDANFEVSSVEVIQKPINLVTVNDKKTADQIVALLDKLDSLDDVQRVYANIEIPSNLV